MALEITTQPVDTTVTEPDAATFTCEAELSSPEYLGKLATSTQQHTGSAMNQAGCFRTLLATTT